MNIILTGKKITQDERILAFKKDNLTAQMTFTVDTDDSWVYKLDVRLPVKCCTGEELFNIIDLPMDANRTCTIDVTAAMVPLTGKYTMQLRGISGEQVYHSDTFEVWVKYSIDPGMAYDPVPSEFYQIEDNITEINNNPPKPGENGYWLIWDAVTHQYKESAIPLPEGTLPEVNADTSGKYLRNDGKKAYWAEVQAGTESKIDKIEVNNVEQPIIDKTVNIAVPTKTSDLSNDSGYITNEALNSYATKAELPTKVSQLENDSKFINESALDGYAKTADIPTKTSQLNNDSGYITANDIPVKSVDGATGDVVTNAVKTTVQTLTDAQKQQARTNIGAGTSSFDGDYNSLTNKPIIPTKTSELNNDSGFITIGDVPDAPVTSVNGKTGVVALTKNDIGLGNVDNVKQYSVSNPPPYPVTSVNGQIGAVDVRELPSVTAADNGKFMRVVSGAWAAAEGDASFDITGASTGQSPIINAVDTDGKPTAWGTAVLAKADGSNIPTNAMDTWRARIAALPGVKVYGKADADGKIKAYTDAACTQAMDSYIYAMQINEYGNALLIYDNRTYQCVGFEEPASMQGSGRYIVVVFFRSEIATDSAGVAVLKVETAKLNIMDYLSGAINAPITITAGELPLTATTTT